MIDRAAVIDRNFVELLEKLKQVAPFPPGAPHLPIRPGSDLSRREAREIFTSQVLSRHVDLAARDLKNRGLGFYTIGSSGHEGNAAVAAASRHTDPAMLHYRSGAFFMERARTIAGETPLEDVMLSLCASREDPISGGRHKVFGSVNLAIPPMTSTIASHLPRAVGAAFFHERARNMRLPTKVPEDAIFLASFGDASSNHNVATGAFNAAGWASHQGIPLPLLFVCEDNGIGISVPTPEGWVERSFRSRPGFEYVRGNGTDLASAYDAAAKAVDLCRTRRTPVFLHLRTVRLLGHAGNDVEWGYRTMAEIEEAEALDPLLSSARLLVHSGAATAAELLDLYERTRERVAVAAEIAGTRPRLTTAEEVVAPLARHSAERVRKEAARAAPEAARHRAFRGEDRLPERATTPRTMAQQISLGLRDIMAKYDDTFVFGEDVARKGGVYYNTAGLLDAFGPRRVFNTLLDETTILGLALGGGMLGYLPIPEIQYLAYLHNAIDQIRGEATSLPFFSNGQFANPMVVRIAAFGYQKGFGGHFHNDNSIAALRDIPGLIIVAPSRPADAVRLMRTACAMAKIDGKVVAFLEPIALYHEKDLYEPGDGLFQQPYPPPGEAAPFGEADVFGDGEDLLIVTYANGVRMSERAAKILKDTHGINTRIVDLRWLLPLDEETVIREAKRCRRVLVVDEGRRSGGVSEAILALLAEQPEHVPAARVTGEDTFIPLGDAANLVLPSVESVVQRAVAFMSP